MFPRILYSHHSLFTGNIDESQVYHFPNADPYLEEDTAFLEAVRTGNKSLIRSSYSDAAKTYKLSWGIRTSSEQQNV